MGEMVSVRARANYAARVRSLFPVYSSLPPSLLSVFLIHQVHFLSHGLTAGFTSVLFPALAFVSTLRQLGDKKSFFRLESSVLFSPLIAYGGGRPVSTYEQEELI